MTDTTAKLPARHRAAPVLLPSWLVWLSPLLGGLGLFAPSPWHWAPALLAIGLGVAYFVQHFRRAAWVVTTGLQKELDR